MDFSLKIDYDRVERITEDAKQATSRILFDLANTFAAKASDFAPVDTGNLAQGIASSLEPPVPGYQEYTVSDQTKYGRFVNDGTKPHMPPVEALKPWARRVLGDESLAWPVAKAIAERGTAPTKFWERAYVEVEAQLDDITIKHTGNTMS